MPSADVVELFVAPINALSLRYFVTGGVATIAYGVPRLTNDVDLVIQLNRAAVPALLAAFASDDFAVPPEESVLEEAGRPRDGHFNVIHVPSAQKADFYLLGDAPLHAWALARSRRVVVGGRDVWLAPAEYVIVRKLLWYRMSRSERHLRDVRAILEHAGDLLDGPVLASLVAEQGLAGELDAARRAEL
jgi:hypothetical protein